jgi:GH24 family phage-related lysozyme (muramidase)
MDSIKRNWTQQELEQIYLTHVKQFADKVVSWAKKNNISLNQNQIDALVSATFNFGPGFLNRQVGRMVAANPNDPAIRSVWEHASDAQARKYRGLADRRRKEAAWYFGYR